MVPPAGVAHLVERDLAKVEVASSSLVARSKKKHHPSGWCFLFGMPRAALNSLPRPARSALNQEVRQGSCEWLCHSWDAGSESSLVTFFAFAVGGGADNKICTQSQKKHYLSGGCFLFGMPRAGLNSLPRPARSALNQEVRQGSCEWLCHSWDAGSESSLVMRTSPPERWST